MPTIAWGPSFVKPGTVSHQVGSMMDLFTTSLALAEIPTPDDRVIDGIDLSDVLKSNDEVDRAVFHYRGNTLFVVRWGLYKGHLWTWTNSWEEYQTVSLVAHKPDFFSQCPLRFSIEFFALACTLLGISSSLVLF